MFKKLSLLFVLLIIVLIPLKISAQNLNSNNYTLVAPTIDTAAGIINSNNYSGLVGSSPVDEFITTSSNYSNKGGTAAFVEANVPIFKCIETSTNSISTNCTGVPGANGMQGVCSIPGCYDRAKFEINIQGNAMDARYAIELSTTSDFSSNNFYLTGATHIPKTTLAISDFLFKCDWEGTLTDLCNSSNLTWQKYNMIGLTPGTLYYIRASALKGSASTGSFTQSAWSPILSITTQHTFLTFKIDIGPNPITSTSIPPYLINLTNIVPNNISTSQNYIILRTSTNALNGINVQIKGLNGALIGVSSIPAFSGDLTNIANGYGIRNSLVSNSQINSGFLGNIAISTSPIDFSGPVGIPNQIGGPTTSFNNLFNSQGLPLNTGSAAFNVKIKADLSKGNGNYTETLTTLVYGTF